MISSDYFIEQAVASVGMDDFGPQDFRDGFELLIEDISTQDDMLATHNRPQVFEDYILRLLKNRLWFENDLQANPEILEQRILPPVAIISLPRTSTTKLQRILSVTPSFHHLLYWQGDMFARIPGEPNGGVIKRRNQTRAFEDWTVQTVPGYMQGHPMYADAPEEEVILMEHAFRTVYLAARFHAPNYAAWLQDQDMRPAYRYMKRQLQYLQWQFYRNEEKPWLLKTPLHYGLEDVFTEVFSAQSKIICPHRHPAEILPSIARAHELNSQLFYGDTLSSATFGEFMLHDLAKKPGRHIAWRDTNPDVEVLDLSCREINSNAVATAEKIHDFLAIEFTPDMQQQIESWERKNPHQKHEQGNYSLEKFGLTEMQIRQAFGDYLDRFGEFI